MGDYDLNHDQQFSALDVGYFLACWRLYKAGNPLTTPVTFGGWTGTVADGDFNHDGKIDHLDAKMIVEEWILPLPARPPDECDDREGLHGRRDRQDRRSLNHIGDCSFGRRCPAVFVR